MCWVCIFWVEVGTESSLYRVISAEYVASLGSLIDVLAIDKVTLVVQVAKSPSFYIYHRTWQRCHQNVTSYNQKEKPKKKEI